MLKLICIVKRQLHLSHEEFLAHWRDHHAPLIKKHSKTLGILRYVQNSSIENTQIQTRIEELSGLRNVNFDGIAELWYEDLETHLGARSTQEGDIALREIIEDEGRFVDLSCSYVWYCNENDVIR